MFSVARAMISLQVLDVERVEVLEEGIFKARGVLLDRQAGLGRVGDDLVVDVGDVHDVADVDSLLLEESAENIDLEEGAEISNMAVVVDGTQAYMPKVIVPAGDQVFDLRREGVEESYGHS